jgi:DNA-binding NtrC family response regulator
MSIKTLLVYNTKETRWLERLLFALGELATILPISLKDTTEYIKKQDYDLIVIDEAGIEEISLLIKRVQSLRSSVPIVVAAEMPTWQEARAAFQAGASDVIRASMSPEELANILRDVVSIPK